MQSIGYLHMASEGFVHLNRIHRPLGYGLKRNDLPDWRALAASPLFNPFQCWGICCERKAWLGGIYAPPQCIFRILLEPLLNKFFPLFVLLA